MIRTTTRYAKSGDVHIAYQVMGAGPIDCVFVPGFVSNLEVHWEDPGYAHLLSRLSSFCRLICFDKRGTGLSDAVSTFPSLEQRMDDVRAVMDAVGSQRAVLLGASEGGPMSILFAATYPHRTRALVLYGTYAHFFTWVSSPQQLQSFIELADTSWGSGAMLKAFAPGMLENKRFCEWWAKFERLGASPRAAIALARMNSEIDVRDVLPAVRVPTLVLHRSNDVRIQIAGGRYIARHIASAKFVEVPGSDHPVWIGDTNRVIDEIEEFVTGARPVSEPERLLATILVVTIANAAPKAAFLGDRAWGDVLRNYANIVADQVDRHRGREIANRQDGITAVFDGPARAVRCALSLLEKGLGVGLEIKAGIHTGEVETRDWGLAGVAARNAGLIAEAAQPCQVLVSSTVRDLVAGSGLSFHHCPRRIKGDQERQLFIADDLERIEPSGSLIEMPLAGSAGELTPREREILKLLARGGTNKEIAIDLELSDHTVKRHVANILTKLDLPTRSAATRFATEHGLV